ncbi:MAG: metal ABC transporter substrate-binding protein [Actinomycetes bacterium]
MKSPATRLAVSLLAATPILAGCGGTEASAGSGPRVVAAFYPLEYVAARVAGDSAEVVGLTTPGGEPHDLELTVRQTAEVAEADVVVHLRDFQPAVDEAVDQAEAAHVVDAAEVADLLSFEELDERADEDAHADEEHGHGDVDPHFWTDPNRLASVAVAVAGELKRADPDNAGTYDQNLLALKRDLDELDVELKKGLADCARDTVVVSHDAFGYFGARYGLDMHAINGLSPDAEPSPAHLRELADLIEEEGITTVFSETLASPEMAESLAGDLGLQTAVLDPVEGLSDATAEEDYLSLMRANLAAVQKANDCT